LPLTSFPLLSSDHDRVLLSDLLFCLRKLEPWQQNKTKNSVFQAMNNKQHLNAVLDYKF
jgi:hypothetical protein